ncbi:hypothetical protein F5883DRAFT_586371 [Diaporthe sp. PMI_573]|nr:hypothetical protein F5883DRAFT_586371 [Diaporthaceae sp. PMI_573]
MKGTDPRTAVNESTYRPGDYVFIANEETLKSHCSRWSDKLPCPNLNHSNSWVARIVEIRARDEFHVYISVCWMYWPDEVPRGTKDGKKHIQGRQPYHGHNELIESNHMGIINVVSVIREATVTQIRAENEEEVQAALYWRQTLDVFTKRLSVIKRLCHCNQPQNPDKVMIQCPNKKCNRWLHEECLRHQILLNTYDHLQTDMTYPVLNTELRSMGKETDNRDLGMNQPGTIAIAAEVLTRAETDGADELVKRGEGVEPNVVSLPPAGDGLVRSQNGQPLTMPICVASRRRRKRVVRSFRKPYEGLLRAELKSEDDVFEIIYSQPDDRGEKRWRVGFNCTVCGTRIH